MFGKDLWDFVKTVVYLGICDKNIRCFCVRINHWIFDLLFSIFMFTFSSRVVLWNSFVLCSLKWWVFLNHRYILFDWFEKTWVLSSFQSIDRRLSWFKNFRPKLLTKRQSSRFPSKLFFFWISTSINILKLGSVNTIIHT